MLKKRVSPDRVTDLTENRLEQSCTASTSRSSWSKTRPGTARVLAPQRNCPSRRLGEVWSHADITFCSAYSGERCKGVALQETMATSGSLARFAAIRKLCPPLLRSTMHHYTQLLRAAVTASLMFAGIGGASVAGPLEDGEAAFKRGDYATALRLWRPPTARACRRTTLKH